MTYPSRQDTTLLHAQPVPNAQGAAAAATRVTAWHHPAIVRLFPSDLGAVIPFTQPPGGHRQRSYTKKGRGDSDG